ncbi:rCG50740, partial [Rattus norvegicus]
MVAYCSRTVSGRPAGSLHRAVASAPPPRSPRPPWRLRLAITAARWALSPAGGAA